MVPGFYLREKREILAGIRMISYRRVASYPLHVAMLPFARVEKCSLGTPTVVVAEFLSPIACEQQNDWESAWR